MRKNISVFATLCALMALALLSGCHSDSPDDLKAKGGPKDPNVTTMGASKVTPSGGVDASGKGGAAPQAAVPSTQ
jgi:hypothetical protein